MKTVRIGAHGRITIPAEFRKKLRLRPGTLLDVREESGQLVFISTKGLLDTIQGSLKPGPGRPSAFDESLEERRRERMRENS